MPEPLYKPLARGGRPAFGGRARYVLPLADAPGPWTPDLGWVLPRERGYHLCTPDTLWPWLHEELYEADGRGVSVTMTNGTRVYSSVRLLRRRRWGRADALHLFDEQLAELRVLSLKRGVPMPPPFSHGDTAWSHLREHIMGTVRWYRAFVTAMDRAGAALCHLSFPGGAPDERPSMSPLALAEQHIRARFFTHVHGRPDIPTCAAADSVATALHAVSRPTTPSTPYSPMAMPSSIGPASSAAAAAQSKYSMPNAAWRFPPPTQG